MDKKMLKEIESRKRKMPNSMKDYLYKKYGNNSNYNKYDRELCLLESGELESFLHNYIYRNEGKQGSTKKIDFILRKTSESILKNENIQLQIYDTYKKRDKSIKIIYEKNKDKNNKKLYRKKDKILDINYEKKYVDKLCFFCPKTILDTDELFHLLENYRTLSNNIVYKKKLLDKNMMISKRETIFKAKDFVKKLNKLGNGYKYKLSDHAYQNKDINIIMILRLKTIDECADVYDLGYFDNRINKYICNCQTDFDLENKTFKEFKKVIEDRYKF